MQRRGRAVPITDNHETRISRLEFRMDIIADMDNLFISAQEIDA